MFEEFQKEMSKGFWNWIKEKFSKDRTPPHTIFGDSHTIEEIVERVLTSGMSVDCFLICLAHNGGKKLHPLRSKYWSIVGGDVNEIQMRNYDRNNYQDLPISREHEIVLKMIMEKQDSYVTLDVNTMGPSTLKDKMVFENLKLMKVYYLHYTKDSADGLYYILVGTTQANEDFEDHWHKQNIYFAINKIRNIIKEY